MAPLYNLSAKYFQKNKERLHEKACKRYQNLSEDKKQSLDEHRKIILEKAKKLYDNEDIPLFYDYCLLHKHIFTYCENCKHTFYFILSNSKYFFPAKN